MRVASGSALFRKGDSDLSAGDKLTQIDGVYCAAVVTGVGIRVAWCRAWRVGN